MSGRIVLRPGLTPLSDWRAFYGGAAMELDPVAQVDVEAGRAAFAEITSGGAEPEPAAGAPSVAEVMEARGETLPEPRLRLLMALKLTALAQGVSGVRWEMVERLADLLANDFLPVVSEAADDRVALSHLFALLTGAGEILHHDRIRPAADVLREAELVPLALNARERAALLSGNAPTLARMLAALFEAERLAQAAIVATALSVSARKGSDPTLNRIVHRLHRQRGQSDAAATLRALLPAESKTNDEASEGDTHDNANDNMSRANGSGIVFRLGAVLDLLRQAGACLERAANAVPEERLVIWQLGEMVPGSADSTALALAADLTALALVALGDAVVGEAKTEADARHAAELAEANRVQAGTPSLDAASTSRLAPMLKKASEIVAVTLLDAARASEPRDGDVLAGIHKLVIEAASEHEDRDEDGGALGRIAERVRSGAFSTAMGMALLQAGANRSDRPARQSDKSA